MWNWNGGSPCAAAPSATTGVLASVRRVAQPSTGRQGDEILLLVGEMLGRLSAPERAELQRRLDERLADLEQLLKAINWDEEGQELVVRRPELRQWAEALAAPASTRRTRRPLLIGALVMLMICLAGAAMAWQGKKPASGRPSLSEEETNYRKWVEYMTRDGGETKLMEEQLNLGLIESVKGLRRATVDQDLIDSQLKKPTVLSIQDRTKHLLAPAMCAGVFEGVPLFRGCLH